MENNQKDIEQLKQEIERMRIERIKLTQSEKEILQLVFEGSSRTEIHLLTFRSMNTIKTHIRHINKKMNTANIKDAARRAKKFGII